LFLDVDIATLIAISIYCEVTYIIIIAIV
jgi:hypothetical protein